MPPPKPDCYDYVRQTYGVPAYIGVAVAFRNLEGVIVPAKTDLHYVHVRFNGEPHDDLLHPKDLAYAVVGREPT